MQVVENWKVINNYPNYSISDNGRVQNDKTCKIMIIQLDRRGYHRIGLRNGVKQKKFMVHLLVFDHFDGTPRNGRTVDHKDTDKNNNHISNLRLATNKQQNGNRGMMNNNTSGYQGVTWKENKHLWRAQIAWTENGKYKSKVKYGHDKFALYKWYVNEHINIYGIYSYFYGKKLKPIVIRK